MTKILPHSHVLVLNNYRDLCEEVVRQIWILSEQAISEKGCFTLVLSGGATPQGIYALMAGSVYRGRFQWKHIHFFWGDERWVSPKDTKSNYRMVLESLLNKIAIPSGNIHAIQTKNGNPQASARLYEKNISAFFKLKKGEWPSFNLILLGLGQDGHIASIFPENRSILVKDLIAISVSQKGVEKERITLTLPVINHAELIFFLVSGGEKADIVHKVLEGENKNLFPAQKIKPGRGKLWWFLDRAAASKCENIPSLTRECVSLCHSPWVKNYGRVRQETPDRRLAALSKRMRKS